MSKWPDGTPKSANNAFDWKNMTPTIARPRIGPIPPRAKDLNAKDSIMQTYARAGVAIGNFPPVAISRGERSKTPTPTKT